MGSYSAHNVLSSQWVDRVTTTTDCGDTYWVGSPPPQKNMVQPANHGASWSFSSMPKHQMRLVYVDENGLFVDACEEDALDPEKELLIALHWRDNLYIFINPYEEKVLPGVALRHSLVYDLTKIPLDVHIIELAEENLAAVVEILLNNWNEAFTDALMSGIFFPEDVRVSMRDHPHPYKKPFIGGNKPKAYKSEVTWDNSNSGNILNY